MIYAVILAAGKGVRFNSKGEPKQFSSLKGMPLFIHSVQTYLKIKGLNKIILVINKNFKNKYTKILKQYALIDKITLINGGITRRESVNNALSIISNEGIIILQNAASPFTPPSLIKKCIKEAKVYGASQAYLKAYHTIFTRKNNYLNSISPKEKLGYTMDPTVYKISLLKKAMDTASKKILKKETTLDIMRELNIHVKLVECDFKNIKVTTPLDIITAENI